MWYQRFLLLILLLQLSGNLLSQPIDTLPPSSDLYPEQLFGSYREHQPLLRPCVEQYDTYAQQLQCTRDTIVKLVYANLRWPATDASIEGTAFVSFTVETDGTLTNFKLLRNPGEKAGAEALRAVQLMAEQTSPWVPATWGPERAPVRVQYNMPMKFKLE